MFLVGAAFCLFSFADAGSLDFCAGALAISELAAIGAVVAAMLAAAAGSLAESVWLAATAGVVSVCFGMAGCDAVCMVLAGAEAMGAVVCCTLLKSMPLLRLPLCT